MTRDPAWSPFTADLGALLEQRREARAPAALEGEVAERTARRRWFIARRLEAIRRALEGGA